MSAASTKRRSNRVLLESVRKSSGGTQQRHEVRSVHCLFPRERLVFGRSVDDATVAIEDDPALSRQHFEVSFDGDVCRIVDLNSANGTYHNDQRIKEGRLHHGDRVRAGASDFLVTITAEESPQQGQRAEKPQPLRSETDWRMSEPGGEASSATESRPDASANVPMTMSVDVHAQELSAEHLPKSAEEIQRNLVKAKSLNETFIGNMNDEQTLAALEEAGVPQPPKGQQIVSIRLVEDHATSDPTLFSRYVAWIRYDQTIIVGSSAVEADWRLPAETKLEPQHFSISLDQSGCYVRSLAGKSSTKVNGEVIDHHLMQSRDRILAGEALFVVDFS